MTNPIVRQTGLGAFEENCREALAEIGEFSPAEEAAIGNFEAAAQQMRDAAMMSFHSPGAMHAKVARVNLDTDRSYVEVKTHIPPVLMLEDGKLVVKLMYDNVTVTAGVGDGSYFFSRVVELLLNPALRAAHGK
jgi:hypothetical protein